MEYPIDEKCIFCRIVAGEIPCAKVYEDDHILGFLDMSPIAQGHTLLVPKGHYPTLLEVPASVGSPLITASQRVGKALLSVLGATGFNCMQNNYSSAGQVVFHAHWHIIPRFDQDGLTHWPGGQYPDLDTMQSLAKALRS